MQLDEKELDEFTKEFLADNGEESELGEIQSLEKSKPETKDENDGSTLWNNASDAQRDEVRHLQDKLAQAQHAADSDRGRNKALHAKVKKMEEDAKAEPTIQPDQGNSTDYTDKELLDIKADLPEVTALVSQETADLKKQLAELQRTVGNTQQSDNGRQTQEQDLYLNQEVAKLEAAHPKFQEIVNSVNYSTWLSRQPSGVRAMAQSQESDNAIAVINMFKGATGESSPPRQELESMVDLPTKGLTKSTLENGEDDFDAHFEHFSKQFET